MRGRPSSSHRVRFVSLFSGVGGLDAGFHHAGATLLGAWDTDADACETYAENHGVQPQQCDVLSLRAADIEDANVVLAGPPCQGFSSLAGREPGDPRNRLIVATARLIAQARPEAFVIENVRGLAWQSDGKYVRETTGALEAAGLAVQIIPIDCATMGMAQRRRRILFVGGRGRAGVQVAKAVQQLVEGTYPQRTVADVLLPAKSLTGLPNHDPRPLATAWYRSVIGAIGPGQKLCDTRLGISSVHTWDVPDVFGKTSPAEREILLALARLRRSEKSRRYTHIGDGRAVTVRQLAAVLRASASRVATSLQRLARAGYVEQVSSTHFDLAHRFNGRFKRLPLRGVAPAVLKEFGWPRSTLHPTQARALTVRECARLQGFPDSFHFLGSRASQYQMVANAFPPSLSHLLAPAILSTLRATTRRKVA